MSVVKTVELGYEIGSGERVEIPIRHMVVTGQTQEAGKTTTLEALIGRSDRAAVAFVTKRGEQSFGAGRRIQPYFRERADWQFVASVLEATMREKLKFERAWIMRASKSAKTLADVQRNVRDLMRSAKGMSADIYMTLDAYLDIVVPRIAGVTFAQTVDLAPGLNVVDVSDRETFPPELQGLVMRSVLEWVYEHVRQTITIIPEAWEFVPQSRGSPVKLAAVELIRKGAGLQNYVWLDTQDIGGVDKELLRSCPVWLLGVQREANEIKRVLDSIPAGVKKPKPADVALLKKGEFFACFGQHVVRTYVRPAWMGADEAHDVALGGEIRTRPPSPEAEPLSLARKRTPAFGDIKVVTAAEAEQMKRDMYERGRRFGFEQGYGAASNSLAGKVRGIVQAAEAFLAELREVARLLAEQRPSAADLPVVELPEHPDSPRGQAPAYREIPPAKTIVAAAAPDDRTAPWMKPLAILAARDPAPLTRAELAALAGMAPRGGGFLKHMRDLKVRGYVSIDGDGLLRATPAGLAAAGTVETPAPTTTGELVELWAWKLPGEKVKPALELLVDRYPHGMRREELALCIDMAPRGGGYLQMLRHLRRNSLVEDVGGELRAGRVLFPS